MQANIELGTGGKEKEREFRNEVGKEREKIDETEESTRDDVVNRQM